MTNSFQVLVCANNCFVHSLNYLQVEISHTCTELKNLLHIFFLLVSETLDKADDIKGRISLPS